MSLSHLAVLLLDQALGVLDVFVELLDVAGLGLQVSQLLLRRGHLSLGHLTFTLIKQSLPLHLEHLLGGRPEERKRFYFIYGFTHRIDAVKCVVLQGQP